MSFVQSLSIQMNVVGALMMRELHTRFGRANIGYLWLFAEPMMLAIAVGLLHQSQKLPISGNIKPVPFAIAGYTMFIMFRSMVSRAETLLEANRPLLNHRQVTLFDMLCARALLEMASTTVVLTLLLAGAWLAGLAEAVFSVLHIGVAIILLGWFSFGLSLLVCALSHESELVSRLVHPLLYLSMPVSGAFFAIDWLPQGWRDWAAWIPTVPIFEVMRKGLFPGYPSDYAGLTYPITASASIFLFGLIAIRAIRPRIQMA